MSTATGRPRPFLHGIFRTACNYCVSSKRGCSGGQPCEQCEKRGKACVYAKRRKSGPRGRPAAGRSSKGRSRAKARRESRAAAAAAVAAAAAAVTTNPALVEAARDPDDAESGSGHDGSSSDGSGIGPTNDENGFRGDTRGWSQQQHGREEEQLKQNRQERAVVPRPTPHRRLGEKWHPRPFTVPAMPTSMPSRETSGRNVSPLLVESPTPWNREGSSGRLEIPLPPPPALVLPPPPTRRASAGAQGRRGDGGHGPRQGPAGGMPRASSDEPISKRARMSLTLPLPPSLASSSSSQARGLPHRSHSLDHGGPICRWLPPTLNLPSSSSSSASSRAPYWPLARSTSGLQGAGGEGRGRGPVTSAPLSVPAWSGDGDGDGDRDGEGCGGGDAQVLEALDGVLAALFPTKEEDARSQGQGQGQSQQRNQDGQAHRRHLQGQQGSQPPQQQQQSPRRLSLGSLLMSEDDDLDGSSRDTGGQGAMAEILEVRETAPNPMVAGLPWPRRHHGSYAGASTSTSGMARVSPVDDVLPRAVSAESCAISQPKQTYTSSSTTASVSGVFSALTGGSGGGGGGWSSDGLLPPPLASSGSQAFQQSLPFPLYRRTSDIATLMMTASSWAGPPPAAAATEPTEEGFSGRVVLGRAAGATAGAAPQAALPRAVPLDYNSVENSHEVGGSSTSSSSSSVAATPATCILDCASMANLRTPMTREASLMQAVEAAACPPVSGAGGVRPRLSREESLTRAMEIVTAPAGDGYGDDDGVEAVAELVAAAGLGDMGGDEIFGGVVAGAGGFVGDVEVRW